MPNPHTNLLLLISLHPTIAKKIFKYIKRILKSHNFPVMLHFNGNSAILPTLKKQLFSTRFLNQFIYKNYNVSPPFNTIPQSNGQEQLDLITITDLDVYAALSRLDPTKACGIDGIGPKVLRSCALALYPVIHHLFSSCLWFCDIPSEWKLHCIVPIHKSGDKSLVSNYRPISLLCSISKVLEWLVYDQVFKFINRKVSLYQFGFLRNHSCLQQLLLFVGIVSDSFSDNSQTDTIYLDFKKAFDKVPHLELLSKLSKIGISGKLVVWLHNYLTNRKQLVSINSAHSSVLPVSSGVPQGSILGPLLYFSTIFQMLYLLVMFFFLLTILNAVNQLRPCQIVLFCKTV